MSGGFFCSWSGRVAYLRNEAQVSVGFEQTNLGRGDGICVFEVCDVVNVMKFLMDIEYFEYTE